MEPAYLITYTIEGEEHVQREKRELVMLYFVFVVVLSLLVAMGSVVLVAVTIDLWCWSPECVGMLYAVPVPVGIFLFACTMAALYAHKRLW